MDVRNLHATSNAFELTGDRSYLFQSTKLQESYERPVQSIGASPELRSRIE